MMLSRDVNLYCEGVTASGPGEWLERLAALTVRHVGYSASELDPKGLCRHNRAGRQTEIGSKKRGGRKEARRAYSAWP